ncbi:hypothetical protein [Aeromicrobium sp. NPDC092404]|uniref:hypothetical protein n=1 Tax=Aeromicrobium sp. NPDC092404 TaxID=3154976 RepID=UPI0034431978
MNQTLYLVDNNAIVQLRRERIKSAFFRSFCRITDDVLREAREHPDAALLSRNRYELTPSVLEQVRRVMKTVEVGDTSLVDLYGNTGAADPGLVASALHAIALEEEQLFADTWVIVTNDRAVEAAASGHGIPVLRPAVLAAMIDAT